MAERNGWMRRKWRNETKERRVSSAASLFKNKKKKKETARRPPKSGPARPLKSHWSPLKSREKKKNAP